jgi:RNA polymerase subunit RPABC4/transcription elongation factor Spt4
MNEDRRVCPKCGKWFHKFGLANHISQGHEGRINNPNLGKWVSENLKNTAAKHSRDKGENGGIRRGSGRGKKGWYEGYWCDSSWELAWVIYAVDHSIEFSRNTAGYIYEFEGDSHKFYPDFLLGSGQLVEVKGYFDPRNKAKIAAVKGLTVLGKKEMQVFIQYAIEKFGSDFVSVAYQCPPEHVCVDCGKNVSKKAVRCSKCWAQKDRDRKFKIKWPDDEKLLLMIASSNKNQVAKTLGVSFNSVLKRLRNHGLVAPM